MANKIVYSPGEEIKNGVKYVREAGKRRQPCGLIVRLIVAICPGCNKEFTVWIGSIRGGKTFGCATCGKVKCSKRMTKHGKSTTIEYQTWCRIIARCFDPSIRCWKDYGGRGITVCDRWRGDEGFVNFLSDMGERPGAGFSIDRINNDGPYSPENCRWATAAQQARNTRQNFWITHNGRTQVLADWARELGINHKVIFARLNKFGWSVEDALTIRPVLGRNSH